MCWYTYAAQRSQISHEFILNDTVLHTRGTLHKSLRLTLKPTCSPTWHAMDTVS